MSDIISEEPKTMNIEIEHSDGTVTNWIDDESYIKPKKKIDVAKKPKVSKAEIKSIEDDLIPKKAPTPNIDEQFYALNLKLQQFYSCHPDQCKFTKDQLIAMQPSKKNLQALSFAYQSYCLADNTAFTQMLGRTTLDLSAIPIGTAFGCRDELTEELNNDVLLNQKLQDLAFTGISRNELPPALVIGTLYANDLVKAKNSARAKIPLLEKVSDETETETENQSDN